MSSTAETIRGTVAVEPDVALPDLRVDDYVLGTPNPDTAPLRTLHRVVEPYGKHRVPLEPPSSRLERFASRLEGKEQGILVERVGGDRSGGQPDLAMFASESTPTLDRVANFVSR